MKLRIPKSKKSIAKTLMLSYTAIVLVCMLVISVITVRYENIIREENQNLSKYIHSGVSQSVKWILNDIRKLDKQLKEDTSIQSINQTQTFENYWNTQSTLDGIENLKDYTEIRDNIDLVFIYLKISDEVVSSHGIISSNMFYNLYFEDSGISYEDWIAILKDNKQDSYINLNFNNKQERVSAFAFISPLAIDKNAVSVIAVDKNEFLKDIKEFEKNNSFDVYIYNSYNRLIFSEKHSSGEIPYTVTELKKLIESDKNSVYTLYEETSGEQWVIATAIPKRMFDSKILFMRVVIVLSVIFALLVLFIIIRYFIKRNTEYLNKVSSILNIDSQGNEFQSLFQSVEQLLTENRSLKQEQNEKEEYLKQMFITGMFRGNTASVAHGDRYSVTFPGKWFVVITFYVDDADALFADEPQMSISKRREYLMFIIRNVFEEKFNDDISGYVTEVDSLAVGLMNLCNGSPDLYAELKRIADERVNIINKNFGIELSYVLSDILSNSTEVPDAYVKTLEALEYKKRTGIQENMIYSEVPFDYSDGYLFSTDKETRLIKAIRSGNADEAIAAIEPVLRILENNSKFSREYAKYIVQDILSVITRTASELPGGEKIIESGISLSQKVSNKNLDEIHELIAEWLGEVCNFSNKWSTDKSDKTRKRMQKVIEFVESNYTDPSLNIASIGEHFNMSPYYVSKLFKEEIGIALIDYINRYRIQKAKELMENSNLSGKAIAEQVGFNHVRSFYRLLKKHIGDIEE